MSFWLWFSLAGVFVVIEILSPTFYFLWLGIAAAIVGGVVAAGSGIGTMVQWLLFAVFTVACYAAWFFYLKKYPTKSLDPLLNSRAQQMIGKKAIVVEAVRNGQGRIKLGDTTWSASANQDIEVNSSVTVIAAEGALLKIKKI